MVHPTRTLMEQLREVLDRETRVELEVIPYQPFELPEHLLRIESAKGGIKVKIGITGHPGVGKTTLVLRVLERVPMRYGGMITQEIRKIGRRVGFSVRDLMTGREGILAHLHLDRGPRLGRYRINLGDLEEIGVAAIERAIGECELVVVDEVGPMELRSRRFIQAVERALESDKHLLVTVHRASNHHLAYRIRHEVDRYIRLSASNRDRMAEEVIRLLGGGSCGG